MYEQTRFLDSCNHNDIFNSNYAGDNHNNNIMPSVRGYALDVKKE